MTDISEGFIQRGEEALTHFGVKGMKWGVRNEKKSSSGGSKQSMPQKIATSMTDRELNAHKQALSGKGVVGKLALADKYTWGGKGRFEGYHNKSIAELERSKERIAKGEIVAQTILFGARYTKEPKVKKPKA